MCTDRTMNKHITEAMRIKAEMAILKAELDKHTDFIKAELDARDKTSYTYGKDLDSITVTWKERKTKRLDQKKRRKTQKSRRSRNCCRNQGGIGRRFAGGRKKKRLSEKETRRKTDKKR